MRKVAGALVAVLLAGACVAPRASVAHRAAPPAPVSTLAPAPTSSTSATSTTSTTAPAPSPSTTAAPRAVAPPAAPALPGDPADFALYGFGWCRTVRVYTTVPGVSGVLAEIAGYTGLRFVMVADRASAQIAIDYGGAGAAGPVPGTRWSGSSHYVAVGRTLQHVDVRVGDGFVPYPVVERHELAHAVGLAHAAKRSELMFPVWSAGVSPSDYAAGDVAGLRAIGATEGC